MGIAYKLWVEFISLRVGDYQVNIGGIHPFGKRVGYGLWQSLGVGCPGEHHLGAWIGGALDGLSSKEGVGFDEGPVFVFLNGDEVAP